MRIDILTLFPQMCEAFLHESIIGRAIKSGAVSIYCHQIRSYTFDKHHRVDDTPYGGGKGMLMMAEPIAVCFEAICQQTGCKPRFVFMSPKGKPLLQQKVKELATFSNLAILCGHYEGVDQRLIDALIDEQISIGDYVITGGELPALILADAVSRLVPGVLSDKACFEQESHFDGLLEFPQYTKPSLWRGRWVPEVLLSGNHAKIKQWQKEESLKETMSSRPELIASDENCL